MDTQLAKTKAYLVPGDKITIADISCWGWVASHSKFDPVLRFDFGLLT